MLLALLWGQRVGERACALFEANELQTVEHTEDGKVLLSVAVFKNFSDNPLGYLNRPELWISGDDPGGEVTLRALKQVYDRPSQLVPRLFGSASAQGFFLEACERFHAIQNTVQGLAASVLKPRTPKRYDLFNALWTQPEGIGVREREDLIF